MSEPMYDLHQQMGELQGLIKSLSLSVHEDRNRLLEERKDLFNKLDKIDDRVGHLEIRIQPLTYKVDNHEIDIGKMKLVYTKAAAVISFFSTLGGLTIAGCWWLLTHMDEIFMTIRQMIPK